MCRIFNSSNLRTLHRDIMIRSFNVPETRRKSRIQISSRMFVRRTENIRRQFRRKIYIWPEVSIPLDQYNLKWLWFLMLLRNCHPRYKYSTVRITRKNTHIRHSWIWFYNTEDQREADRLMKIQFNELNKRADFEIEEKMSIFEEKANRNFCVQFYRLNTNG